MIVVDECDILLPKEREPLIYYLNRQSCITLVLISNRFHDLEALPQRAKSSLQPIPLIFHPYDEEESFKILLSRAQQAFHAGTVSEGVIQTAAKLASAARDIRFEFNLLLTVAIAAETFGKEKVEEADVTSLASVLYEPLRS